MPVRHRDETDPVSGRAIRKPSKESASFGVRIAAENVEQLHVDLEWSRIRRIAIRAVNIVHRPVQQKSANG